MTRACMHRHARASMFLILPLYMIMHVSSNLYVFYFAVYICTCRMSIRLPVHEHSCACLRACLRVYVLVPCADPVFWPSGLDPPPPRTKNPGSAHGSVHPSINPLKIVN